MIEWANRALALDPSHLLARECMAGAYLKKGDLDRYLAESLVHAQEAGAPAPLLDELRRVYASGGRPGVLQHVLRLNTGAPAVQRALFLAELGKLDEAFQHLDEAIALHDPALVHLAVAPQWDWLRGDFRFGDRLDRMGLREAAERVRQHLS
jgi:tetratricopeptide (TPR) repeat protein